MTEIKHHLTDELLMSYAAGNLPEAFNLVVATHISLCDECRARLGAFEALGGSVINQVEGCAVSDECLTATLRLIEDGPTEEIRPQVTRQGILPAPLVDYIGGSLDDVKWRSLGMGVKQAILPTSKEASVRLLHIPGGTAMPDHGHNGMELTLVLQGAFQDDGDRFGPGDIEIADEALEHTPVAEPGQDCICLAATDAKLKFNAFLPKLAQPFFRI